MASKVAFKRGCRGTLLITAADIAAVKVIHGNGCVQIFTL